MHHTRPNIPFALSAFTALAFTGCVNQLDIHPEVLADHGIAFVGEEESLLSQLTLDADGFALTPVMAADGEEPVTRVAFRFDASSAHTVQVRASQDFGETFGDWQDAEVSFNEEDAYNAHADVPEGTTHAQLRFLAPIEAGLRFLAVEMFEYQPEVVEAGAIDGVAQEQEQGLAADGVAVSRSSWGARATNCSGSHTPNRITVHHTVTPNNDSMSMPARMRQIQAFHINGRGWCDVGYHFLVGQDGRVYQGRLERRIGAHAGGDNTNNAGVSFIGTFSSVAPSEAMMNAGGRILKSLSTTYNIALTRTKVKGHRQVGTTSTECPGNALYPRLQNLIDRAQNGSGGGGGGGGGTGFCAQSGGRTGSWCQGSAVVRCDDGREVSRTPCGSGCQTMPAGTPDRCAAPPAAPPGTFSDVPSGHWARSFIQKAVARGALAGCGGGNFCPTRNITKAELAHALAVLETQSVSLTGVPAFTDVPSAHRASAREVVARGIMQGCTSSSFCPSEPVTRASISVYVRRAQDLANHNPSTPSYRDVARNHWAFGAIERMRQNGIASGCSTGTGNFCPSDNVTRAQAAVFLANGWDL